MRYIADFHIHSKYSHATSKYMDLQALALWGQLKGIMMMGTGDFTHPLWQKELKNQLHEAEQGLFKLKPLYHKAVEQQVYDSCKSTQRFMLTAEISTIFKRYGKCYRTHSIVLAPSFEAVDYISKQLAKIGNIEADGRPIIGCDVKDIVKIALDASPDCMVIPAHIWTPWFGMLGSKSGFNSIADCFEEMLEHIYAVETGLSSNYLMNAQISDLDKFALLCNSDAHSVQKLGREANLMNTELTYVGITSALKQNDPKQLVAGIEFFPERGKYYGDGHRACNVYMTPEQTSQHKATCPTCNKQLTVGVLNRVMQLASRTPEEARQVVRRSHQVIPLLDIISHHIGMAETSKKVQKLYHHMLQSIGCEFYILLKASLEEVARISTVGIAQSIAKLRTGDVVVQPGYDGVYGQVQF